MTIDNAFLQAYSPIIETPTGTKPMPIRCDDMQDFLDVIAGLVERGITFKADTSSLTVTTTGGY